MTILYELPHDRLAPAQIPGILRTVLTGPWICSSDDIGEAMGMTVVRRTRSALSSWA